MNGEPETSEPASPFDPAAGVGWKIYPLNGNAVHCFSRPEDEAVLDVNDLSDAIRICFFCYREGFIRLLIDPELAVEGEIDGSRPDLFPFQRFNGDVPFSISSRIVSLVSTPIGQISCYSLIKVMADARLPNHI